jgi:hypothetical protein
MLDWPVRLTQRSFEHGQPSVAGLRQRFRFRRSNRHARAVDLDNDAARYGQPWFRGASADEVRARDWKKGVRVKLSPGARSPGQNSFLTGRYRRQVVQFNSPLHAAREPETARLIALCGPGCPTNPTTSQFPERCPRSPRCLQVPGET